MAIYQENVNVKLIKSWRLTNTVCNSLDSPPEVLNGVEGCDESEVARPVLVLIVLVVPQRPPVLQWVFDEQLWVDDFLARGHVFRVTTGGLHLQRGRRGLLLRKENTFINSSRAAPGGTKQRKIRSEIRLKETKKIRNYLVSCIKKFKYFSVTIEKLHFQLRLTAEVLD